jgi:hypothetical protein
VSENGLFEPFRYIKTILLPRQARDKHRESTQKQSTVFLQDCARGALMQLTDRQHEAVAEKDVDAPQHIMMSCKCAARPQTAATQQRTM